MAEIMWSQLRDHAPPDLAIFCSHSNRAWQLIKGANLKHPRSPVTNAMNKLSIDGDIDHLLTLKGEPSE